MKRRGESKDESDQNKSGHRVVVLRSLEIVSKGAQETPIDKDVERHKRRDDPVTQTGVSWILEEARYLLISYSSDLVIKRVGTANSQ